MKKNIFSGILILFIFILIFIITLSNNTESVILGILLCYGILMLIYKKNNEYREIASFSFAFYSLLGVIAYSTYLHYSGNTFAPYTDDSYYFRNINTLWNGSWKGHFNYTLYEYLIAAITFPIAKVLPIEHYQLLPINWMLGSLFVTETLRFCWKVQPTTKINDKVIGMLLVLCNYSCIDSCVHLYRDPLVMILMVLSLNYLYNQKLVKGIICSCLTLFVRGANGMILFIYLIANLITEKVHLKKRTLIFSFFILLITCYLFIGKINYGSFGRFANRNYVENNSISERIENFRDSQGGGLVLKLLRSNNIILQTIAIPAYMISPVQVKSFKTSTSFHSIYGNSPVVERFRVEGVFETIHILIYSFVIIYLFYGLFLWLKKSHDKDFILSLLFILTLILITLISMQSRHKMAFIIFFPIMYDFFANNTNLTIRNNLAIMSFTLGTIILAINIIGLLNIL